MKRIIVKCDVCDKEEISNCEEKTLEMILKEDCFMNKKIHCNMEIEYIVKDCRFKSPRLDSKKTDICPDCLNKLLSGQRLYYELHQTFETPKIYIK